MLFRYSLVDLFLLIPTILISLTFHEFAHAFVSYKLGDPTAKMQGRLTLNPLKHLDILGTLMMLLSRVGWAKPVPINPMYYKDRKKGTMLVSLAGPLSNILLAILSRILIILIYKQQSAFFNVLISFAFMMYSVNLMLAIFNLLPLPPLDGSKILSGILPTRYYFKMLEYERYIQILFLVLVFMLPGALGTIMGPFVKVLDGAISYMLLPLTWLIGSVKIKFTNFEGPIDLLFHLMEKNQINIYDIPISEITDQYMDYLFQMQELDMEIASEFIVMAATLLHIKSRLLLPVKKERDEEDQFDPREELVIKLIEYKKYKEVSGLLREKEAIWTNAFYKLPEFIRLIKPAPLDGLSIDELTQCYKAMLEKNDNKINKNENNIKQIIQYEKVSLKLKIRDVINHLIKNAFFKFSELFSRKNKSIPEVVTGFLAILELAKQKKITLEQIVPCDEIMVYRRVEYGNKEN